MASYSDILFGKIALSNRLVSPAQLQDCLQAMDRSRGRSLAELLVERGVLGPDQARRIHKAQALTQFIRAEKLFARIVLDRGLGSLEQLRELFRVQEQADYRLRLAELLVERGVLTPDQADAVVEEQLRLLQEDTARVEEAGFQADLGVSDDRGRRLEEVAPFSVSSDLDGSTLRRASGPRNFLDAQSRSLNRTMPALAVVPLDDEPAAAPAPAARRVPPPPSGPIDPANLTGATLASRYQVLEKVGEGGMGTVYRAQHCLMEKIVALKVLHPSLVSAKGSLDRFRREIRAASKFQHKNVIQLYDAGEGEGGLFYMAMEFAEGQTLEDLLRRGPMPLERALPILRQMLGAIAEAHKKGIVHRDLKSGNIMIVKGKAGDDVVKVMDFGLAKIALDPDERASDQGALFKTQEGVVTGTPQYMSPEQASGEAVDHRSDLYSLGVIMFEMLCGELPFKSNTPMGYLGKHIVEPPPVPSRVSRQPLPPGLDEVILKLLEKRPAERFQSAGDVLVALEARLSGAAPPRDRREERRDERRKDDRRKDERRREQAEVAEDRRKDERRRAERRRFAEDPPREMALTQEAPAPGALAATQFVEAPDLGPAPTSARSTPIARLVVALGVLLVTVLAGSVWLARQVADEEPALARAEALEQAGDLTGAIALLEVRVREAPDDQAAAERLEQLQGRVKQEEAKGLAERGDALAARWRRGEVDRAGAEEAQGLYRHSLLAHEDPAVRGRLQALTKELASTGPGPGPSPSPSADGAAREALLGLLEQALRGGRLDEARRLLGEAKRVLPAGHPKLEQLRLTLEAEERRAAAATARAAGKLEEARELLQQARRDHPDPQVQAAIRSDLEQVEGELAARAGRARGEQLLDASLQAAAALDLVAARARLREAAAAGGAGLEAATQVRGRALDALGGLVDPLRQARDELARLEAAAPSALREADLRALLTSLEQLRARCQDELAGDAALRARILDVLADAAQRAHRQEERLQQARSEQADDLASRFRRSLERAREQPDQRETRERVRELLDRYRRLKAHPGFPQATEEERALVEGMIERCEARWQVWTELGQGWALLPAGPWRAPDGQVVTVGEGVYASDAEVTWAQWDEFLRDTRTARPSNFPGPTDIPVTMITLAEAEAYCAWRSSKAKLVRYRLPTEGEWERAARGDAGTAFPWGEQLEAWRVKDEVAAVGGGQPQRVRSYPKDKNDWGLFDLVGNVQEMTSSRREARLVLRGGSVSTPPEQAGAGSATLVAPGEEVAGHVGLRVFAEQR